MGLTKLALKKHGRKKRKNLTMVMAGSFFLFFFLVTLFTTLKINIREYWGKMLLGDGAIVLQNNDRYNVFNPPVNDDYFSDSTLAYLLTEISGVHLSKRLRISTLIENYHTEQKRPLLLIGVESAKEHQVVSNVGIYEGRLPEENQHEFCLYFNTVGYLGLEVGDTAIVYTQTVDGYLNYDLMTLSGILEPTKTQHFMGGYQIGYIPLSFAQSLKNVGTDMISEVVYAGNNGWNLMLLKFNIPDGFRHISMWDSADIPKTMGSIIGFLVSFLVVLILFVVFSSIYHNMNMMIIDRYKEIGIFLTYGAAPVSILWLWLWEMTRYTVFCVVIGSLFSFGLFKLVNMLGIYATSAELEVFMATSHFKLISTLSGFLFSALMLWLVVILASIRPLQRGIGEEIIVKLFRR